MIIHHYACTTGYLIVLHIFSLHKVLLGTLKRYIFVIYQQILVWKENQTQKILKNINQNESLCHAAQS